MELRQLGNTGLKLSCVGFGASPLGNTFGTVPEEAAIASVRHAFQSGINFFDTSPYYGGTLSEKVLGKALKALAVPRNEYIVATKCGRYKEGFDFSADRVTRSIEESLQRLQLDYVDILQCHDIEFGSLDQIVNETIPALQKLKEAGKTRFIGITGLPLGIFTYVLDRVPPGTVDVILSYCHYCINDSTLEDIMPYLKRKGVGIISASPLAMGLLTESGPPEWHPASPELKETLMRDFQRRLMAYPSSLMLAGEPRIPMPGDLELLYAEDDRLRETDYSQRGVVYMGPITVYVRVVVG